jgi:hypothetical protein
LFDNSAETTVKKLAADGIEIKNLIVVGKGYQTDEKGRRHRIKFWGTRGVFWGDLWGLFFGGMFLTIPVVGHVIVLGYLASMAIYGIGNAIVVGGLSALGAAFYGIGVPRDSVIQYETAIKADSLLVMAHGPVEKVAPAKAILGTLKPSRLDVHTGAKANSAEFLVRAAG